MIMFIRRDILPDKEALKQQFKFLKSKDIDSIYTWMEETKESCIQYGNNSTSCTTQQVYKYSGVIITNDYLSEYRTYAYEYDSDMFKEEYTSETRTLRVYELQNKKIYNTLKNLKKGK